MTHAIKTFDVAIAGAGPAGTSAAIHLALQGLTVLLVEQKKFPRPKLCGEFISPECLTHFERLGVAKQINAARGAHLLETSFYSRSGGKVTVPSDWFKTNTAAIGLSRAEMDNLLLKRARELGVHVLEEAQVLDVIREEEIVRGVYVKESNQPQEYRAHLTIDATGRNRALAHKINKGETPRRRARFVAFKAHFENARLAPDACEIYFYRGGYGGVSGVEKGLSNLCFITTAGDARKFGPDVQEVMQTTILTNRRAAFTLGNAEVRSEWLSVALESFGRHTLVPAPGLLMIGDAAAFIDPFTGSGMLMALESGAIAAQAIGQFKHNLGAAAEFSKLAHQYSANYRRTFDSRLRVSGLLRRAALFPRLAEAAVKFFGASDFLRRKLAQATRPAANVESALLRSSTDTRQ